MSTVKKKLKAHAITCIKQSICQCIAESENAGIAYSVHCDKQDCWDEADAIAGYYCAVNLVEEGLTLGDLRKYQDKSTGESYCAYKSELSVSLEVYASGCDGTPDVALSVVADVLTVLFSREGKAKILAKDIQEAGLSKDEETRYSVNKTKVTQRLTVEFTYAPSRPSQVFKYTS